MEDSMPVAVPAVVVVGAVCTRKAVSTAVLVGGHIYIIIAVSTAWHKACMSSLHIAN